MRPEPLLDRHHLDTQTGGDRDLAEDLLGLFAEQCRALLPGIRDDARSSAVRADLAHTLKGSALGVGATRVAGQAAAVEDAMRAGRSAAEPLVRLTDAVEATLAALDTGI